MPLPPPDPSGREGRRGWGDELTPGPAPALVTPPASETPEEGQWALPASEPAATIEEAAAEPAPEPEPAPMPGPDVAALLDDAVARMEARMEAVETRVAELARLGARDRDLVDRLHAENQTLRAGELAQAQLPLLRDLIRLHDDVERLEGAAGDGADLGIVRGQLVAVLARAGVDRYAPAEGDAFDANQHQGRGAVPTQDAGRNRTIARTMRCGFRRDGRVIRPAEVEVYTLAPPAPADRSEGD